MADFLATYGIDDKALAIGLKKIEGLASQHAERINASTARADKGFASATATKLGKGLLGAIGLGSTAAVIRSTILTINDASQEYAKTNEAVAQSLRVIGYEGEAAYRRFGREVHQVGIEMKSTWAEVWNFASRSIDRLGREGMAVLTGTRPDFFSFKNTALDAQETATLLAQANAARLSIDAERLSKDPYSTGRMAAAQLRAEAQVREQMLKNEGLLWHLRNSGMSEEANRLERSIKLGAEQIIIDEKRRQAAEDVDRKNSTRAALENQKESYAASRASTADLIEANAQRIFGLEASQRQIQIAETQLRYDKQIRDLAQDKALLEEDRARAAGLLAEQRDAELGILMAQKDAQKTGRSIAIGSSQDARQAFAPVLNEERTDRKMAQQKFDRMISELAKIRSNTGQTQVATYQ